MITHAIIKFSFLLYEKFKIKNYLPQSNTLNVSVLDKNVRSIYVDKMKNFIPNNERI